MQKNSESLSELVAALAEGTQTPVSLAERSLRRAREDSDLNAFVALDDATVMGGLGPIDGIPIAVKDNYLTRDYPTTACSDATALEPSGQDATIVANLRRAGAVIFGKTNMHEWAYGATNTTSRFGPTRNPHNRDHITGGSSGGSGAAVASGIVPAALGSDTGGSVRIAAPDPYLVCYDRLVDERVFAFFGGVPATVVSDNLKSGVTKACFHDPQINRSYADMATHYDTVIIPEGYTRSDRCWPSQKPHRRPPPLELQAVNLKTR